MAAKAFLIAVAIVATIVAPTMADKLYVVGDERGWTLNFDYKAWAATKEFHVGDSLMFLYPMGAHNVVKVNGTEFQSCTAPLSAQPLTTGHDVITLTTPGKHWYICSVGSHCEVGQMKLAINVWPATPQPPSNAPAPSPVPATAERNSVFGVLGKFIERWGH